jgi:hypothetical protein
MCGGEAWRIVEPNNNRKDHYSKNHYHQKSLPPKPLVTGAEPLP